VTLHGQIANNTTQRFAAADDRKRPTVIRRGIRSGVCEQHHKTVEELVEEADDKLFTSVMYNKQHVGTSYTSWYHGHEISP